MSPKFRNISIVIVVVALIVFLLYYFLVVRKPKKEKCPDGRNIPNSGKCSDNPVKKDIAGNTITPTVAKPDANGCVKPSSYVNNSYPLALGMQGEEVKILQKTLNTNFKSGLSPDGYFGCSTENALFKATGKKIFIGETAKTSST